MIQQFDTTSTRRSRLRSASPPDARDATLDDPRLPSDYYAGEGDKIVALISNVRDTNYYDSEQREPVTLHRRLLLGAVQRLLRPQRDDDRRVRLAAPDGREPARTTRSRATPARARRPARSCTRATFAHEYQHLLERYEDPGELSWVNEGLSDYAMWLTGYASRASRSPTTGFDGHVQCFLGWLGVQTPANPNPRDGGPENSLTLWDDQGDGRDPLRLRRRVHVHAVPAGPVRHTRSSRRCTTEDANGLAGLQAVLDQFAHAARRRAEVIHHWAAAVALDARSTTRELRGSAQAAVPDPDARRLDQLGHPGGVLDAGRAAERIRLRPPARRVRYVPVREADPVDHLPGGNWAAGAARRVDDRLRCALLRLPATCSTAQSRAK